MQPDSTELLLEPPSQYERFELFSKNCLEFKRPGYFTDHYVLSKQLGQGSQSKVFLGENLRTNKRYTIKVMEKRLLKKSMYHYYKRKIYLMKSFDSHNIVNVHEYFEDEERIYICLEYLKGCDLFTDINERIKARRRYTEKQSARVIGKIAKSVDYLHQNHILHRDIKQDYIMFVNEPPGVGDGRCKLIDFRTARLLNSQTILADPYGSQNYLTPEVLQGLYRKECDVWSLGVVM